MAWTDSVKIIKTGIAYEVTAGTAATQPQEYTYLNADGTLGTPRDFEDHRAWAYRGLAYQIPRTYHTAGTMSSYVFPETNGFGYWLSGALGSDVSSPTQHGTLPYIHTISAASGNIPSYTLWLKTGIYEHQSTNNQISRLVLNQGRNAPLSATVDFLGGALGSSTSFGTATYITNQKTVFTNQKAYVLWDDTKVLDMADCTLTIDNGININDAKIMGMPYAHHILAANRSITGTATVYTEDTTKLEDFWGANIGPQVSISTIPLRIVWYSETIETSNAPPTAAFKSHDGGGTSTVATSGTYTGSGTAYFEVKCTTDSTADKFKWRKNFGTWSEEVTVNAGPQLLSDGVEITFNSTTGSVAGDKWWFYVGDRPYVLDVELPAARINSWEPQPTANRLTARTTFTATIDPTYAYDAKAWLINKKAASYNA